MTDVHTKIIRSYNMSKIKGKDTQPEILVRKFLHKNGYRYRIHVKDLPGKPDIVLPRYKTVVFVQGCFWHGHEGCKYYVVPKTRTDWWLKKINETIVNDKTNQQSLVSTGWRVIEIWECELRKTLVENTLNRLLKAFLTKKQ
ncbi:very short patch repair endonuclease [Pedobacter gandavensis]|uniref:very short patch repair endonuclease n=1 Tax=Pedobacter gandavensis TaxID=2679963 RepID=UPI0029302567|nr:very short patch repair endonuclease [Pedobacter gandavensis]